MTINEITSTSNEKIKNLKKLGNKKTRDESGQFLVENLLIINDALKAGFKPVSLFVTQDILDKKDQKLKYILDNLSEIYLIDEKINKSFTSLATPAGICAVYKKQDKNINLNQSILYLNGVSDPGNVGTILRTALAFGINNIVVDVDCADIYNPKTIQAARDAIFKVNIEYDTNFSIFKKIKAKMKIYATNVVDGVSIKSILKEESSFAKATADKEDKSFCVVLGNEANGVSKQILKQSDGFIKIDMNSEIESLNVAISAGIILYEIRDLN